MLRRYLPTVVLLLVLLAIGGMAIANTIGEPSLARGGYIPTLSSDPKTAQVEALLFVLVLGGVIFLTIGLGLFLAITFYRITRMMGGHAAAMAPAESTARPAGPKAPAKSEALSIPLSSDRSAAIFWVVVVLIAVGFQVVRLWGQPIGYLPSIGQMLNMPLFKLPGQHINGLPSFIAGPGDPVTALHVLIGVLLGVLGATAVVGFAMARGFARLSQTVKSADTLPPTLPDRLIPAVEARITKLREPRSRTFSPRNPIDSALVGLNVLLLLVIAGIVALYVVPSYGGVAAVDRAIQATRQAALVTATPQGGGSAEQGGAQSGLDALKAEFAALPAGQASGGEQVFSSAGCVACHSLEPDVKIVGPSLAGVATRAATRKPDYPPEIYLYESITNPNAYVVEGFPASTMPQTFKQTLSAQQLADVIAFLLTKK